MKKITLFLILSLFFNYCIAQVGIGTVNPTAALDVQSTTGGLLAPRVSLTTTLLPAPVVNPQGGLLPAGTMVYNINTVADVTPGYYYWNGTIWVRMAAGAAGSNDWSITGNAGTNAGTNFLGTTDPTDFRIRTNNTNRWNISNASNGQLQSYNRGTANRPIYSFQADTNTGLFSNAADVLGISTNGTEKLRVNSNGNVVIGTTMGAGAAKLHVTGNTSTVRIDNLNSSNANNNGIDSQVVKVNANGDLVLEPSVSVIALNESQAETFFSTPVIVDDPNGDFAIASGYTTTITLTKETLVEIVFWTGVRVTTFGGGVVEDGAPRLYGGLVTHVGTGTDVVYSASSYTNSEQTGNIAFSTFTIGGNGYISLPAGTHTFELAVYGLGGDDGSFFPEGFEIAFGENAANNRFQIIYHN